MALESLQSTTGPHPLFFLPVIQMASVYDCLGCFPLRTDIFNYKNVTKTSEIRNHFTHVKCMI